MAYSGTNTQLIHHLGVQAAAPAPEAERRKLRSQHDARASPEADTDRREGSGAEAEHTPPKRSRGADLSDSALRFANAERSPMPQAAGHALASPSREARQAASPARLGDQSVRAASPPVEAAARAQKKKRSAAASPQGQLGRQNGHRGSAGALPAEAEGAEEDNCLAGTRPWQRPDAAVPMAGLSFEGHAPAAPAADFVLEHGTPGPSSLVGAPPP